MTASSKTFLAFTVALALNLIVLLAKTAPAAREWHPSPVGTYQIACAGGGDRSANCVVLDTTTGKLTSDRVVHLVE